MLVGKGKPVRRPALKQRPNRCGNKAAYVADQARRNAIDQGIRGLDYDPKSVFLEVLGSDEKSSEKYLVKGDKCYLSKTEVHNIRETQDPDVVLDQENEGIVYPGAILKANKYLLEGSPQGIIADRGYVNVYIDFCTGQRMDVQHVKATETEIKAAIDQLVGKFWALQKSSSVDIAGQIAAKEEAFSSAAEMAIKLNVDTNFLGFKAKVDLDTNSTSRKVVSVVDFTQRFYTVCVETSFRNRADYFGDDVTWDRLCKEGINNQNPPVLVKSVTYGRRMYLFKEYEATNKNVNSNQSTSFCGNSVSSAQNIAETKEATRSWVYIRGGGARYAMDIYDSIDDNTKYRELLSKSPTFTRDNPGKPLDYQMVYLRYNDPINIRRTGFKSETFYAEYPRRVKIEVDSDCWGIGPTLNHLKVAFDYKTFRVENGRKVFGRYMDHKPEWKLEQSTHKTGYLPLQEGEYVDGEVRVQVRRKWCGRWANATVEYIAPVNGYIGVEVNGHFKNMNVKFKTEQ